MYEPGSGLMGSGVVGLALLLILCLDVDVDGIVTKDGPPRVLLGSARTQVYSSTFFGTSGEEDDCWRRWGWESWTVSLCQGAAYSVCA